MHAKYLLALAGLAAATPRQHVSGDDCASFALNDKFAEFDVVSVTSAVTSVGQGLSMRLVCNVTVATTHRGEGDHVYNHVWLPLDRWDGRLVVLGGGNFATMDMDQIKGMLGGDYVAAATEGGLSRKQTVDASLGQWITKADGKVDKTLLTNFAHRAVHDLAVLSKAATRALYGSGPNYSYFHGCSTGGRMGYDSAWRHPRDFDGIVAGAPVLYLPDLVAADLWPIVVMQNTVAPPQCVWTHFLEAGIDFCDADDGLEDGLISRPDLCKFDPRTHVGRTIACSDLGRDLTITAGHANAVAELAAGPKTQDGRFIWYGIPEGSLSQAVAYTYVSGNRTVPHPMTLASAYVHKLFLQDPTFDLTNISYAEFEHIHNRARCLYSRKFAGEATDLRAFRQAGGKLLSYHALNDPIIPHDGTVHFWDREKQRDPNVDDWYRLFLYAGGGHCASDNYAGWGAYGFRIRGALGRVIDWVEKGSAPDVMESESVAGSSFVGAQRPVCAHPRHISYKGQGLVESSDSFHCV